MLFFRFDSVNAAVFSLILGVIFSYFLRYHAEYSKTVDGVTEGSPSQIALVVRFILFQAIPSAAVTLLQLEPFRKNFPRIFHFRDPYVISILLFSLLYTLSFNTYIVLYAKNTKNLTNWFRLGYALLLIVYPFVLRHRLRNHHDEFLKAKNVYYRNFMKFSPFGYVIVITVVFTAVAWYLCNFPIWGIPVTYALIIISIYCYYRDYTKTTSNSSMLALPTLGQMEAEKKNTNILVHPLKPNFHYCLVYGICGIILIVLAQLYVNATCAFSTESWESCLSYYLTNVGDNQRSSPRRLLWKLMFRLWTSVFSFIMELYCVFAFTDNHFLHRSYFWRFTEDLMVCVGLVTENNFNLLMILLILNFFFIMLKDAGFVDDMIWSLINRQWIYSKPYSSTPDSSTLSLKLIEEVRSQVIRSKLNFVSRISSITCIGIIALLDKTLFTHGDTIWQMSDLTNIIIAVSVVLVQVAASRQLNFIVFARKKARVRDIASCFQNKPENFQDELDIIDYEDPKVIADWKLYLSLMSILAIFVVFIDLHNLPL
ncbi:hypothetical protein BKA69DRAFT_630998 [Paraphysoderma sedebokerense]|nr:hypothetical protein BKA69DRAFT_630998 [Paraphysoderma sedebokerense]